MKKLLMAIVAIFLLSACGKEELTPQTVTFILDSNPTTGYSWQVEQSEELFEVKSSFAADEKDKQVTGAGGEETITLVPLKAGKTEVTLTYARPWETTDADRVFTAEITVADDLSVTSVVMA